MLNEAQIRTVEAIISIFETGRVGGPEAYSTVTLLNGDTGGLTYGKHQTTINSGNLYLLIKAYCEDSGSDYKAEFAPYMARLLHKDPTLGTDAAFKTLLRKAGSDADMQEIQDSFFRRVYWMPCAQTCQALEFKRIVSWAIVYDSFVHGSWGRIKALVDANGTVANVGETAWIKAYNAARRNWLATHSNPLLRNTVYRQDAFNVILRGDNWDLKLPLTVRGISILPGHVGLDSQAPMPFSGASAPRASAEGEAQRLLMLIEPHMTGSDVDRVKRALYSKGYPVTDGDAFDGTTAEAVRLFQAANQLRADGIVGNATRAKLGI